MTRETREICTRFCVPETNRVIIAAACQQSSIRTKSYRTHPIRMAQRVHRLSCSNIPDTNSLIVAAAHKKGRVCAESERPDTIGMSMIGLQWRTAPHVIDPDIPFRRANSKTISLHSKCNGENIAEGMSKGSGDHMSMGELSIGKRHILQVCLPHREIRTIYVAQIITHKGHETQHIGSHVASLMRLYATLSRKHVAQLRFCILFSPYT